jgi:hypothetical protein
MVINEKDQNFCHNVDSVTKEVLLDVKVITKQTNSRTSRPNKNKQTTEYTERQTKTESQAE